MIEAIVFALLVVFHIWRSIFRNTVQWLFVVLPLVALYVIARWAVSVSIRDSPGYRVHFCDLYQQEGARHMTLGSYGKLATEVYDITKPVGQTFEGGDRRLEFYLERLKSCTSSSGLSRRRTAAAG